MRTLIRLVLLLVILIAIAVGAVFVLKIDIPFLPFNQTAALPTLAPPPAPPTPTGIPPVEEATVVPPPITSSDECDAVANASGIVVDAEAIRGRHAKDRLPNGRPFPRKEPRHVNIPTRAAQDVIVLQFTPESTQQERNAYIQAIGGNSRRRMDKLGTTVVRVPAGMTVENLPPSPIVRFSEPDYLASAVQLPATPNDPQFGDQWALPVMGIPATWEQFPTNATQVTVAVIDSGVCAGHPDLAGRLVAGYDFVEDDADPQDAFGHGCGVAGVIAANINNGQGMAGVAPNVRIMPLRVLDASGLGNYSTISEAIIYAADNGAQIINLSLAGSNYSVTMAEAVAYAVEKGVTVIAAAGNNGVSTPYYPAAFPGVIAVGSIDPDLQRSAFSNYGTHVQVFAPGRDILMTTLDGGYDLNSGTSFAAPQVAGVAAMSEALGVPLNVEENIVFLYPPDNTPKCQ